ncbi:hypothetical protein [Yaniella halotolerans]|uniref:hypothetical protein n=1 Tax=Yaniella halotolerans TaxID=225453 RepID=UPI0003B4FF87|nr:hypothetical protein [Yaniella halotolerans]
MTTRSTLKRTIIGFVLFGVLTLTGCGTDIPSGFLEDGVQTLPPTVPADAHETVIHYESAINERT